MPAPKAMKTVQKPAASMKSVAVKGKNSTPKLLVSMKKETTAPDPKTTAMKKESTKKSDTKAVKKPEPKSKNKKEQDDKKDQDDAKSSSSKTTTVSEATIKTKATAKEASKPASSKSTVASTAMKKEGAKDAKTTSMKGEKSIVPHKTTAMKVQSAPSKGKEKKADNKAMKAIPAKKGAKNKIEEEFEEEESEKDEEVDAEEGSEKDEEVDAEEGSEKVVDAGVQIAATEKDVAEEKDNQVDGQKDEDDEVDDDEAKEESEQEEEAGDDEQGAAAGDDEKQSEDDDENQKTVLDNSHQFLKIDQYAKVGALWRSEDPEDTSVYLNNTADVDRYLRSRLLELMLPDMNRQDAEREWAVQEWDELFETTAWNLWETRFVNLVKVQEKKSLDTFGVMAVGSICDFSLVTRLIFHEPSLTKGETSTDHPIWSNRQLKKKLPKEQVFTIAYGIAVAECSRRRHFEVNMARSKTSNTKILPDLEYFVRIQKGQEPGNLNHVNSSSLGMGIVGGLQKSKSLQRQLSTRSAGSAMGRGGAGAGGRGLDRDLDSDEEAFENMKRNRKFQSPGPTRFSIGDTNKFGASLIDTAMMVDELVDINMETDQTFDAINDDQMDGDEDRKSEKKKSKSDKKVKRMLKKSESVLQAEKNGKWNDEFLNEGKKPSTSLLGGSSNPLDANIRNGRPLGKSPEKMGNSRDDESPPNTGLQEIFEEFSKKRRRSSIGSKSESKERSKSKSESKNRTEKKLRKERKEFRSDRSGSFGPSLKELKRRKATSMSKNSIEDDSSSSDDDWIRKGIEADKELHREKISTKPSPMLMGDSFALMCNSMVGEAVKVDQKKLLKRQSSNASNNSKYSNKSGYSSKSSRKNKPMGSEFDRASDSNMVLSTNWGDVCKRELEWLKRVDNAVESSNKVDLSKLIEFMENRMAFFLDLNPANVPSGDSSWSTYCKVLEKIAAVKSHLVSSGPSAGKVTPMEERIDINKRKNLFDRIDQRLLRHPDRKKLTIGMLRELMLAFAALGRDTQMLPFLCAQILPSYDLIDMGFDELISFINTVLCRPKAETSQFLPRMANFPAFVEWLNLLPVKIQDEVEREQVRGALRKAKENNESDCKAPLINILGKWEKNYNFNAVAPLSKEDYDEL